MSAGEARDYHTVQAQAFAGSRADLITAITMTYPAEAIGVTEAARTVGMPVGDLVHRRDRRPAADG